MTSLDTVTQLGQSLWYDNIQRKLLENGDLAAMLARGDIRGVTSNPSIFHAAIARSSDYDSALLPLAWAGWPAEQIFWQLAVEDICAACDLFLPLYNQTGGGDGFVSLEVSPFLAGDAEKTVEQALHLWQTVARPNLMIKVPATTAGLPAIRRLIAAGLNINVTLIFSLERYGEVMDAYLSGLEDRLASLPAGGTGGAAFPASVASFFVSRLDTKLDARLPAGSPLRGRAAVANSKLAYAEYQKVFSSPRFARLQAAGARPQRPLWASTSTKNPDYPDTIYVDNLIGPGTVNTVPPQTLEAFRDHGRPALTLTEGLDEARRVLAALESAGLSLAQATLELEQEGVRAFADAFTALLQAIEDRRQAAAAQPGALSASVSRRLARLQADSVPARLHAVDPALWTSDPAAQAEVKVRLGWLKSPESSRLALPEIAAFVDEVRRAGLEKFLLLGMGGSSLAPEVLSLVFSGFAGASAPAPGFAILDSTDPAQVLSAAQSFPPEKSLYIVSSKSGGTAEVNAFFNYFWALSGQDGSRFIAITDPGTSLEKLARERGFRRVFLADPTVGGRYSALTAFGMVPAALMGLDAGRALDSAAWMMRQCAADFPAARNPGLALGAVLAEAALAGRDKLTILADPALASFGSWLEQLIAESSGKQGQGIVVVDGEPPDAPSVYGADRLFVYLRQTGGLDPVLEPLRQAGHPVLEFPVADPYSLFAEFYRWELATAAACHILGVNAFDQPDVQDNKDRTKARIAEYQQQGRLVEGDLLRWTGDPAALLAFLSRARPGDYVAVNAYLPRTEASYAALNDLRVAIRKRTGCAVTVGFGPRFLHSTGQLHKGGPVTGLFLQITADPVADLEIPAQGMTFGALEHAQALGDAEALSARGRPLLRLRLPAPDAVRSLAAALE